MLTARIKTGTPISSERRSQRIGVLKSQRIGVLKSAGELDDAGRSARRNVRHSRCA
jgi:hypothetical protein